MSLVQISVADIVKDLQKDLVLRERCLILDANTEKHLKSIERAIEQLLLRNPKPALSLYSQLLTKAKKANGLNFTCALNAEAKQARAEEQSHLEVIRATLKAMSPAESPLLKSA